MITVGKPYITVENDTAYLSSRVTVSDDSVRSFLETTQKLPNCSWLTEIDYPPASWKEDSCLWFSVDSKYAGYLNDERSNAFVLAMFWYAMASGSDIAFEVPLSQKLYNGLTKTLMPALEKSGFAPIKLLGPVTSKPLTCCGGYATGMSCGVDSFYTLLRHATKLTHLTFYNGSYILPYAETPYSIDEIYDERDLTFSTYASNSAAVAAHYGLPLVMVNTNLDKDFYRGGYIYSAMYRFTSCSLALEHLFSVYISSSSGHSEHGMEVSLFSPTQHYEDLLCECLQTETFRYMTSDHELRTDKIKAVADEEDFQSFAEVCFNQLTGHKNCGKCYGCWKTMIPLDLIGKLDKFQKCFDLDEYYKNRREIFADLIRFSSLPASSSARETVRQILELAKSEPSDAGCEFIEVYNSITEKSTDNPRH